MRRLFVIAQALCAGGAVAGGTRRWADCLASVLVEGDAATVTSWGRPRELWLRDSVRQLLPCTLQYRLPEAGFRAN